MKKALIIFIILSLLLFPLDTLASTPYSDIEYFSNGDYIVYSLEADTQNTIHTYSKSISKSKIGRYYHNNSVQWYVKVTGTFTYGSGSAKCTSASVFAKSNAKSWKITNSSSSKKNNSASASATAKQYYDGSLINTIVRTVTLTCSPTGTFS